MKNFENQIRTRYKNIENLDVNLSNPIVQN